jgi:hypothetical protein
MTAASPQVQKQQNQPTMTEIAEIVNQNKPFHLISGLTLVFHHSVRS